MIDIWSANNSNKNKERPQIYNILSIWSPLYFRETWLRTVKMRLDTGFTSYFISYKLILLLFLLKICPFIFSLLSLENLLRILISWLLSSCLSAPYKI